MPEAKGLKQYIQTLTIDRNSGESLSETFEPYTEEPEINDKEFALRFLRAVAGDFDQYVNKMLNDFEMQEGERTSRGGMHRAKGA